MGLLVLAVVLTVGISFVCSLLEAVILSITPAYVAVRIKEGRRSGQILDRLKKRINRPLIAILSVNTITHTGGSATISLLVLHSWGEKEVAVASGILTFLILVVSEILPKTIGASYWKQIAPLSAYLINALVIVTFPIVFLMENLVRFIGGKKQKIISRAEIIESAELGATEGSLKRHESVVIKNLLMLNKVLVSDIMTPRGEMTVFPADATVDSLMSEHMPLRFTRVPVYSGSIDNIVGVVHRFRIMDAAAREHHDLYVRDLMSPIEKVDENISVAQVLDLFILRNRHLFIVINEQGTVDGLVTMEDAIETLLGVDIVDEFESVGDVRRYAAEMLKKRHSQLKQGAD